ncbi:MAG: cation transporter [Parachlamydiaceae bacterium]|nr:cation transporter [Parachlamydiaceae bacterium]
MTKFPKPVPIPDKVFKTRKNRIIQITKSAKIGVSLRMGIIILELIGVYFTQSSALFTDAMASLTDVISTIFLIFCIKLAQRPPDRDHPFGHGRYEPLGGLLLGLLLMVLGGVLFVQQLFGVGQEDSHQWISPFAWIFPLVAVLLLEISYRLVMKTAKEEDSPALAADAAHYRVDSITSFMAMIALIVAAYVPTWSVFIDHIGAVIIAIFMIILGVHASRKNFHQLMDRVPDLKFFDLVNEAALNVRGVKGTEKIRIQSYGPDAHVDIDIEVEPQSSVEAAHKVSQKVRAEIQKAWPAVRDVTVHIEPYYANDH